MAMLYLADGKAWIGNVGDSRVYLARGGKLFQLTRDHSAVYAMMLRGEITREQMRKHPQGNVIGAFIGMEASRRPHPYAHQFQTQLCKGDRFMLCSDGLSDLLKHEELQQKVVEGKDPNLVVNHLIWRAMEMGGKDNTTCIVLDVSGPMLKDPTPESLASLPAV